MVNMVPHEAFACSCAEGDVVLRQSYKPESCGKLYYACPKSKPPNHFGCGFFLWKDTRLHQLMSSPGAPSAGPSTPPSYSLGPSTLHAFLQDLQHLQTILQDLQEMQTNCKHLRGKRSVLKATMNMHMHPEQHTVNLAALLHEVLNKWKNLIWSSMSFAMCNVLVQNMLRVDEMDLDNYWAWPIGRFCTKSSKKGIYAKSERAVGVIRLRFRYPSYPYVPRDLHDALLPLLVSYPEEVHPVLPNQGKTMHERPAGKIGLYTRVFDFANFKLPLSTFLVDILRGILVLGWTYPHYTLDEKTYPLFLDKDRVVAPDRGKSKLDASVDKLFDEGGSGAQTKQGDSASVGVEQGMNIQPVSETTDVVAEDVIPLQPRCLKKRKTIVSNIGGPSYPPKNLREDHGTQSGVSVGGKSRSVVQRLFIGVVRMLRSGAEVDSFAWPSVPVITAATTITSTVDPAVVVKEKLLNVLCLPLNLPLLVELILPCAEVRMRAEYNIREKRRLKSVVEEKDQLIKARDEEIDNLKAQLLLKEVKAAEAIRLRAEAFKLETVEKSLRDEVNALNEHNTILENERNAMDVKVTDLEAVVVSKERELTDATTQLTSIKSQNDNLADQVYELQLYTDFVEMTLHLEERFYPHLLTTIARRRCLLTYEMELAVAKCLNLPEYLSALGIAINKAIEKGMQGMIRENIMSRVSFFQDVFIPLAEPFSVIAVRCTKGTSYTVPTTTDTTAALSITFASAIIVDPISIDEYEVTGTDDQPVAIKNVVDENANPFLNFDDAKLNIP
nr:hypothetical protein [Tanacetum cinerariifolium]